MYRFHDRQPKGSRLKDAIIGEQSNDAMEEN